MEWNRNYMNDLPLFLLNIARFYTDEFDLYIAQPIDFNGQIAMLSRSWTVHPNTGVSSRDELTIENYNVNEVFYLSINDDQ
jgi:hypothetical protein